MSLVPDLGASPAAILAAFRGEVIAARVGHPDVLQLEVVGSDRGRWLFVTQDAEWRPADPSRLVGRTLEGLTLDPRTGELALELSGDGQLRVVPAAPAAPDDPPSWELLTPDRIQLEFGPGIRWRISAADDPLSP
ncbi:MAG TPA: hypothetical protein VG898_11830 [Solirubrobacterales bacterium]|nr:hypothetical protein [Solirubrobacterales bacterium]